MPPRTDDEHLRRLITEYFGAAARLRQLRPTTAFGAPVFVVDFDRGVRHYRTFGSFGPTFGAANPEELQVTEQSSMDLLYPAQLVFHYERLMSRSCSGLAALRCGASCAPISRNALRP